MRRPGNRRPISANPSNQAESPEWYIRTPSPSINPSAGILLNLTPDHLDRHGTMEHYAALKARLVAHARHPIVGDDDDWCREVAERLRLANRTWVDIVSARSRVAR